MRTPLKTFVAGLLIVVCSLAGAEKAPPPSDVVYELNQVEWKPRQTFGVEAAYPSALRKAKVAGWAEVRFVIDETGAVKDVSIVESSHADFEKPVITATRKSKWLPARKAGQPVSVRVQQRIAFEP